MITFNNNNNNENNENNEKLFWKVFKNKFIFNKIFSNFKYSEFFPYENIIGVTSVICNYTNAESIIKDKIKCNKVIIDQYIQVNQILKLIYKNNQENQIFYKQLFRKEFQIDNLYLFSINSYSGENFSNNNYWISNIFRCCNFVALEQYLKIYNDYILDSKFIIRLLFENLDFLKNSSKTTSISFYKFIKFYDSLNKNNLINNQDKEINKFKFDSLVLFYKYLNLFDKSIKLKHIIKISKILLNHFFLSHLTISKLLSSIGISNNSNSSDKISYKEFQKKSKYRELLSEIGEIESNKIFTKDQLNLSIKKLLLSSITNGSINIIKSNISKYFKLIYSIYKFNGIKNSILKIENIQFKPKEYYIFFSNDLNKINSKYSSSINEQDRVNLLEITFYNQKENQLKILNNVLISFTFTLLIFQSNNIEILVLFFQYFMEKNEKEINGILYNDTQRYKLLSSIKKKEIWEYFYKSNELRDIIFCDQKYQFNWCHLNNFEMYSIYEDYMIILSRKIVISFNFIKNIKNPNSFLLQVIQKSLKNKEKIYEFKENISENFVVILGLLKNIKIENIDFKIEFLKDWSNYKASNNLVNEKTTINFNSIFYVSNLKQRSFYKFMDLILNNYSKQDILNKLLKNDNRFYHLTLTAFRGNGATMSKIKISFYSEYIISCLIFSGFEDIVFDYLKLKKDVLKNTDISSSIVYSKFIKFLLLNFNNEDSNQIILNLINESYSKGYYLFLQSLFRENFKISKFNKDKSIDNLKKLNSIITQKIINLNLKNNLVHYINLQEKEINK